MAKELKRFAQEDILLKMSDSQIRQTGRKRIGVLYGFNNYGCNLKHINELKKYILEDYPDTKDEDIEVWYISDTESIKHARFTMLRVTIPTEDFIKLRTNREIYVL